MELDGCYNVLGVAIMFWVVARVWLYSCNSVLGVGQGVANGCYLPCSEFKMVLSVC